MSEETVVTYELEGEIALIGLNRPDKRNALSPDLMKQLLTLHGEPGTKPNAASSSATAKTSAPDWT
jgi:enoyl-CoA hydratase/carnithine racemase